MVYTGYWAGEYKDAIRISISVGDPYWLTIDGKIKELAPYGIHGKYTGNIAKIMYVEMLERLGIKKVLELIKEMEERFKGEDIILCCWENVFNGKECHRRWLAEWIKEKSGYTIDEHI